MESQNKINYSIKIGLILLDILIIYFLLFLFIRFQYEYNYTVVLDRLPTVKELLVSHYKAMIILLISWFIIADYIKFYTSRRLNYLREIILKIIYQLFFFAIIFFTISGLKSEDLLSNKLVLEFISVLLFYLLFTRVSVFFLTRYFFNRGYNIKNILVIGESLTAYRLKSILEKRKHFGYKMIHTNNNFSLEYLKNLIDNNQIREVFISQSSLSNELCNIELLNYFEDNHIKVNYIPDSINDELITLKVKYIDTVPVFEIKKFPLEKPENQFIKLFFDLILSTFICVFILSWLFPIIAILIKIDSKGSVIFKQKRRGLNGNEFDCYKFRTMINDGTNSIKATVVNDLRVTRFGNFLRKTSLDELPQFINVLKGDMSVVGPRPHMISQDVYFSEIIKKYNLRNYVKPGITGLAQVKGFRGAINSVQDMEGRIQVDLFYVRNWSLLLDIQVLYQTIILILKGDKNAI